MFILTKLDFMSIRCQKTTTQDLGIKSGGLD